MRTGNPRAHAPSQLAAATGKAKKSVKSELNTQNIVLVEGVRTPFLVSGTG